MTRISRAAGFLARVPRPTRAAGLLLVIATILELLGQLIRSTGVTIAAAAALGAVIGDAVLAPRIDGFLIKRDLADRLTAGIPATMRLTAATPTGRRGSRRPVVLVHQHPGLAVARVVTTALAADASTIADVPVTPSHRGHWYDGGSVVIEAFSPLGGFVRRHRIQLHGELRVHPGPAAGYVLPDNGPGDTSGSSPTARAGSGADFFGIREWRSGDAANAVHWRASARRSQLVVIEREQPARSGVVIICGAHQSGDSWERSLARAAATAVSVLQTGRPLTLLAGDHPVKPSSSQQVLDYFADLSTDTTPNRGAISEAIQLGGRGASLLWLSDEPPADLGTISAWQPEPA